MARLAWLRSSVTAATLAAAAAGCGFENPDHCFIQVASVVPGSPVLNVGETVTLRLRWNAAGDCLPRDTTAKSLRWEIQAMDSAEGIASIDSIRARVTALRPGEVEVDVRLPPAYGITWDVVRVVEPPTADSLMTIVRNQARDSATVILENASGITQRAQTLAPLGIACWVTPLSDSVRYRALVYSGPPGPIAIGGNWVAIGSVLWTHTWRVTVGNDGSLPPSTLYASPKNGDGC
jgi:hypothetical protein